MQIVLVLVLPLLPARARVHVFVVGSVGLRMDCIAFLYSAVGS